MDLIRTQDETYIEYVNRLVSAKRDNKIGYTEFGDLLLKDLNTYSDENLRKAYYVIEKMMMINADDQCKTGVKTRILSISDLHIPFQLPISTFSEYENRVDILQLNGDTLDCQSISKFPKTYRINPVEEMIIGRQYIIDLIEMIKPKKVIITYGNHELRFGSYLAKHLDNELQELMPETSLDYIFNDGFNHYDRKTHTKTFYEPLSKVFADIEIEYTGEWYCQIGNTVFCHPKTFSSAPLKTAEKAMLWFRNEGFVFDSLIMAHTHRVGEYKIGNTVIYEQGASCDVKKMAYGDGLLINSQKEGFAYICQDKDGKLIKDHTKIIVLN